MYSEVASNKRKTVYLILAFVLILGGLGWVLSQIYGTPTVFIGMTTFAFVYAIFGYLASAKIALAMAGAKPVTKKQAPELYRVVENLTITAGLPMPKVYIVNDPAPNAFATGRKPDKGVIAVNTGLLEIMDKEELEGVVAHELSHIGNYDIRVMAVVLVLVTIIAFISDFFFRLMWWGGFDDDNNQGNAVFMLVGIAMAIIAPVVATLLKLSVSRKREYLADASGVLLTRYPEGLASALAKIGNYKGGDPKANSATAHMYISNPLNDRKKGAWLANLFSTHPPLEDRIAKLHAMGGEL